MIKMTFTDLEELTTSNTLIPASANRPFPLNHIGDVEFERLVYWLYKTEIKDGDWKGKYDEIRLMQASSDKARDCVIYINNQLHAVIQCKHSSKDTPLAKPIFAKEISPNDSPVIWENMNDLTML